MSRNAGKLTITREHTVWCSTCSEWHSEAEHYKSYFVKVIKRQGWTLVNGLWRCPECSKAGDE